MSGVSERTRKERNLARLAEIIGEAIKRKGIKPATVADLVGLNRPHLYRVLKGEKSLGRENALALADVLGISHSEILDAAGHLAESDSVNGSGIGPHSSSINSLAFWEIELIFKALKRRGVGKDHLQRLYQDGSYADDVAKIIQVLYKGRNR